MKTLVSITLICLTAIGLYFNVKSNASTSEISSNNEIPYDLTPEILTPDTYHQLNEYFSKQNFTIETIEHGVPAFVLKQLPEDLNKTPRIQEKKRIFFLAMLPMILLANEEIMGQRKELLNIFANVDSIGTATDLEKKRLAELCRIYKIRTKNLLSKTTRERLLARVDTIPTSMALAQAATESAYGTSRFALLGNNLFGEWTFIPGTGIVPAGRPEGQTYEVRRFEDIYQSVRSYMNNLNTHKAYASLRNKRAQLRRESIEPEGHALATGLLAYSARGQDYINDIQAIIRHNKLSNFSSATLRSPFERTYAAIPGKTPSI